METRVEIGDLFVLTLHVLEPQRQRRLLLCTFADLKKPLSSDGFRDRPFYHDTLSLKLTTIEPGEDPTHSGVRLLVRGEGLAPDALIVAFADPASDEITGQCPLGWGTPSRVPCYMSGGAASLRGDDSGSTSVVKGDPQLAAGSHGYNGTTGSAPLRSRLFDVDVPAVEAVPAECRPGWSNLGRNPEEHGIVVGKGIDVDKEHTAVLKPDVQSFNLEELLRGGALPHGMGPWTTVFQALGRGNRMPADELMNIMDMSGVSGELSTAYIDPQLRSELGNQTVKQQIQKLSNDTGMLMKAVHQDPLVQQLAAMDPAMSKIISSPSALKKIFSPELLDQVQHGEIPDQSWMQTILDSADSDGNRQKASMASPARAPAALVLENGLRLKQVRPGDGKHFPQQKDLLSVQYAGYLTDGTLFDHGEFGFELGASEVIRGWEIALPHMSLGERAALQVPAALGYGGAGKGPIPPGADLIFDVELRSINKLAAPAVAV
ncbi:FPR1 [Symbiodinium microadriaticum]|nr:FPR1 [Symbiodinium microadriaticum]